MLKIIESIIEEKRPVYLISPHLDDAVFSAGGVMAYLRKKRVKVTVVNVFTGATARRPTLSARRFLRQCGERSAKQLFLKRRREDREVLGRLGIKVVNMGYLDALWRMRKPSWGKVIAELGASYPVYRWRVTSGRVSRSDDWLRESLAKKLEKIVPKKAVVMVPAGIGGHVDHIIVREVGRKVFKKIIYWADFPYWQKAGLSNKFIEEGKLDSRRFSGLMKRKKQLMLGYKTQGSAVFPKGVGKLPAEVYFVGEN